jgi:antitoxin CcdA
MSPFARICSTPPVPRESTSPLLWSALTEELAAAKRKQWREENREAIDAYNAHIEKHGTFSDYVQGF